jgi:hypothetical protein
VSLTTSSTCGCTDKQYPSYTVYRKLVGQFLPQETAILWAWGKVTGKREQLEKDLYRDQEDVRRRKKQT